MLCVCTDAAVESLGHVLTANSWQALRTIMWCCMSSVVFFCMAILQMEWFCLQRFYASLFFSITSMLYHFTYKMDRQHRHLLLYYWLDQIVIWPAGCTILSMDTSWHICALVTGAVLYFMAMRPTTEKQHTLGVHLPIMVAMCLQRY
jgi:hypothetical protein